MATVIHVEAIEGVVRTSPGRCAVTVMRKGERDGGAADLSTTVVEPIVSSQLNLSYNINA